MLCFVIGDDGWVLKIKMFWLIFGAAGHYLEPFGSLSYSTPLNTFAAPFSHPLLAHSALLFRENWASLSFSSLLKTSLLILPALKMISGAFARLLEASVASQ
jgi:hypothetical protein